MDELLPVLVARVANRDEAVPAIEAALRHGIAFLRVEEPPSYEGPHALEVHVPEWTEPVLLMAEPAGEPLGVEYPLALRPFAPEHIDVLVGLLAEAGVMGTVPPPPASAGPAIALDAPVDLGFPEMPEVDLRLSEPPAGHAEPRESAAPAQIVGRTLGGKYAVEKLLGSGAMGDVYRATHLALQKAMAVKVLHPSHRHNEDFITSFKREALAASRLDHPNVVQVIDFGHEPDGLLYIVMELLAGADLGVALTQQRVQPTERIVDIMVQVCGALSASHDQNVVHRDVKPDNIILVPRRDDDGTVRDFVKVCDFGIAEIVERGRPGEQRSQVAGTPDYMAPEQVLGQAIDARADIYACGVILYEMATGRVPFADETTPEGIAASHVRREPPAPSQVNPSVDRRLEAVILKAMSKDPARRYPSARDLRADLLAVVEAAKRREVKPPALEVKPPTFDDDDVLPPGVGQGFVRNDAIDIGDLFSIDPVAPAKPGAVKEQIWVLSEQMATELIQDPARVLARLDTLADPAEYARDMATLERAMASAAQRGAAAPLLIAVSHLAARAGRTPPGDRSREALAARALLSIAKPELLFRLADDALDGAPATREPARRVLIALGPAGSHALVAARERAAAHGPAWPGRPRFVATMREIGPAATNTLADFLQEVRTRDPAILEDMLRAVPDTAASDPAAERLGQIIATIHIRHDAPGVRRSAAAALSAVWGSRANAWLAPLLEIADDGLRIAAIAALRKHGGIDREVVRRIERLLTNAAPAGADLRTAAAAALVDTTGPARTAAAEALAAALRPAAAGGLLSKLMTAEVPDDPVVLATMAQAIITLAGENGIRIVEARAARSAGEVRARLLDVVARARH